jgi:hypothetical protein
MIEDRTPLVELRRNAVAALAVIVAVVLAAWLWTVLA